MSAPLRSRRTDAAGTEVNNVRGAGSAKLPRDLVPQPLELVGAREQMGAVVLEHGQAVEVDVAQRRRARRAEPTDLLENAGQALDRIGDRVVVLADAGREGLEAE